MNLIYAGFGQDPAHRRQGDGDAKEMWGEKAPAKGEDMGKGLSMSQPINSEFINRNWGPASRERITCKS